MVEHENVYTRQADLYEKLILREDYRGNLPVELEKTADFTGKDVLELGAGTGRLTRWLAPRARQVTALDLSPHMLFKAADVLWPEFQSKTILAAGDHTSLPVPSRSADVIISGWSVCYLVSWHPDNWVSLLEQALSEMERVLRPGGRIILVETQGTGGESPNPPDKLVPYYEYLECHGYSTTWLRTDYRFETQAEAEEISEFFFGSEMLANIIGAPHPILPECTGIWWKEAKTI